jgi:hypothetical protein
MARVLSGAAYHFPGGNISNCVTGTQDGFERLVVFHLR